MKLKVAFVGILLSILAQYVHSQVNCEFSRSGQNNNLICRATIINPNGLDSFTKIGGSPPSGFNNENVITVVSDRTAQSPNIPRILCDTFKNIRDFTIVSSDITEIGPYSLRNCKFVRNARIYNNKISKISPIAFENSAEVTFLDLRGNLLQSLPNGVFRSLTRLGWLNLNSNQIRTLQTDAFGSHPNLVTILLNNNGVNALSPAVIERTNVMNLGFNGNQCASGMFSGGKEQIREHVKLCIDNYLRA